MTGPLSTSPLPFTDLGTLAYAEAYAQQQQMLETIVAARDSAAPLLGHVFLVEHPPVITVSARTSAAANIIASPQQLEAAGVSVAPTDRGGDVTYHGPGQLVAYPIIDLNAFGLRLHEYMRLLEQVVIDTCTRFGVGSQRDPGATGVWVPAQNDPTDSPAGDSMAHARKIAAMGVRVRKWVSMHGLALNVTTNLDHFRLIVPCGLVGRPVTSLQRELGDRCPKLAQVKSALLECLNTALAAQLTQRST